MTDIELETMLALVEHVEEDQPEIDCRSADLGCGNQRHMTGCIMATLAEANFLIHDYRKRVEAERITALAKLREESICKWSHLNKIACHKITRHNCEGGGSYVK